MSVFKKIGHGISWAYKPAVNVKAWMGWDIIKSSSIYVYNLGKSLVVPQKAESSESFEEALARLNLTEADLKTRQQEFMQLFVIYAAIGVAIILYCLYLFYTLSFMGGLLSLVVASLSFALAFRYHFWVFQIKQRKLGCSVQEWWHSKFDDSNKDNEGKS
jgi:intracellular multiplication protein IcmV